jgi:hypothetical protein
MDEQLLSWVATSFSILAAERLTWCAYDEQVDALFVNCPSKLSDSLFQTKVSFYELNLWMVFTIGRSGYRIDINSG